MKTPALYIAEELMPFLRAKLAEFLYSGGMTQAEIGEYLGLTQAMVSKYLAGKYRSPPGPVAERLIAIAEEGARFILYGGSKEDAIVLISRRLVELLQSGFLCKYYAEYAGISEEACRSIYSVQRHRGEVLEELALALRRLLEIGGFGKLIPEVRSNFAYALNTPSSNGDVAAVPGRITVVKGKPFALPPEFGVSNFTAGLLVEIGKIRPEVRSVLNIRAGGDVEAALKRAGMKAVRVKTGGLPEEEAIRRIAEVFRDAPHDAVVDEGGHGVEPMVYLFGEGPFDVVDKLRKLVEALENEKAE
ncbi:thiamine-phosphate synthase family protein [Thermococcus sp. Bubb.Bath]|uniref:thiamine-phosphate synthase family protein n=1 Tax=Thermococcus sp. Bubb.Bath TaxID=1638242 RepID=UPI00143C9E06|nr:thiamine-phosphate synthase family protein [Thermococcus sp. Bubb.Bath]NJF25235.1 helix-turn-helix domain-containing protein [Thermococcus sp. Bubb.Bath]